MSCFIMTDCAHATLANSLEYILNSGFNRFGFEAPESLHKALHDCRDRYGFYTAGWIYNRLYALNNAAYEGRYRTEPDPSIPPMPTVPALIQERQYANYHETLQPWHYQLAKLLHCLTYQTSEDATRNDPLHLALMDFQRVYNAFLVCNHDSFHAAPWGSI